MRRRTLLQAGLAALPAPALAQGLASRPVRIIVAAAPGGGNDLFARLYAPPLGEAIGRTVVVENRAGAAGLIGAQHVVQAAPDGHTMLYAAAGIAINPSVAPSPGFDPQRDLMPLTQMLSQPFVLVVAANLGVTSIAGLLDAARQRTTPLAFGTTGAGSITSLVPQVMFRGAGITAIEVPYRGAGPLFAALMSGEVQFACQILPVVRPGLESGQLVPIAVTAGQRMPQLPTVPTLASLGYADLVADQWHGMFLPARTPAPVADLLTRALVATVRQPAIAGRLAQEGAQAVGSSPAEFAAFFAAELARWADIARAAGAAGGGS